MTDLNSWEDEQDAHDEGLSQQTRQNLHIGTNPQAQAFQPGAPTFQPGQQFRQFQHQQQQQQQQQSYGGGYGQYYGQNQAYGGYNQYGQQPHFQQQHQGQAYGQMYNSGQQGYAGGQQFSYNKQPYSTPQQQAPVIVKRPKDGADLQAKPTDSTANGAPKAKVLSIGGDSAPKAKVLSIGGDTATPKPDAPNQPKVMSLKSTEPISQLSSATTTTTTTTTTPTKQQQQQSDDRAKVTDEGSKPATARSADKSDGSAAAPETKGSTDSSGQSGASKTSETREPAREVDAVAKEQHEYVDEETLEEMYGKEHVNVIFLGHVDAGKSTLGGSILYATGMVDERTMEKYKKEAKEAGRETWYLSWALDLTREERSKGKTVEVGRGFFETEKRRYTILDAPGHKTFVPNMIGGASQADVGVLVISARRGEYETGFEKGGQTREHAVLAKTQGVNKLVVVVNKMDDVTVNWSQERYKECTEKLSAFLKSVGYNPKTDFAFMPISAQTGVGIKERVPDSVAPWHSGASLLEYLDSMQTLERKVKAPFMMPIAAKYRDMGTMVEGKIESGVIKKGGAYIMMPNRDNVTVGALYGETEDEIPNAQCGDQVRLRLRGVEEEDILPGFVLCSPGRPVHCVSTFEAQIVLLELKSILSAGFNCVLHVHCAQEEVTFASILHKLEKGTGRKSKRPPGFATKGMSIIARLEVIGGAGSVCVERFEDYPQLGRFTLRDQGQTIAIGKITKLITDN